MYSMNKTWGRRKVFIIKLDVASQLSSCSAPSQPLLKLFLGVKLLYDYGLWGWPPVLYNVHTEARVLKKLSLAGLAKLSWLR